MSKQFKMFGPCQDGECEDCAFESETHVCACDCHDWPDEDKSADINGVVYAAGYAYACGYHD